MAEQLKQMQAVLEAAIELSKRKDIENNKEILLKNIKEHPHFQLFLANINKKLDGKETPIHWAMRRGINTSLFDALETLSKEAVRKAAADQWKIASWLGSDYDILQDVSDLDGSSVFLIAVQTGNMELVQHLLQKKADINSANKTGMKALHIAAEAGNVPMVQFLIEQLNLNPQEIDAKNRNIFYIAEIFGHKDLLDYLQAYTLSHKRIQSAVESLLKIQGDASAVRAMFSGEQLKYLIANINQKYNGLNVVQLALRMGANTLVLEKLLDLSQHQANLERGYLRSGYDVIHDAETPDGYALLHIAAKQGRTEIIELLLKRKADINQLGKYTGRTPLLCAVKTRKNMATETLLSYQTTEANVNVLDKRKKSLLIWAIQRNQLNLLGKILEKSAVQAAFARYNPLGYLLGSFDILIAGDERGLTPLHYAVKHSHSIDLTSDSDLISQLIKLLNSQGKGKAIDAPDSLGLTPLHHAIMAGNLEAVKLLVIKGKVNINAVAPGNHNITPLLLAARLGNMAIVDYLLSKKADLGQQDSNQRGIFFQAVQSGNIELIKYLLQSPLTRNLINQRDRLLRLPLHMAARLGLDKICQLIIETSPNQLYEVDKFGETPIRSAYRVARTHLHDLRGDNLSTVDLLRQAMNQRIDSEVKELAALRRERFDLDGHSMQFLAADNHQKLATRHDLVTDLLQPVMNADGSVSMHQVKILHEGKGFHCVALVPSQVEGEQVNLKIVFCTPTQTKDIMQSLQQLNKLDAVKNHMGFVCHNIADIVQQLKQKHPHSSISLTVSGKGIGGDDAQYCMLSLMQAMEKDKQFEPIKNLRLVTVNAPKVNKETCQVAAQLAQKLTSIKQLQNLTAEHLLVEGSLLPLAGDDYLLNTAKESAATHMQFLRDKKLSQEMQRVIPLIKQRMDMLETMQRELAVKQQALYPHQQELQRISVEIDKMLTETKRVSEALKIKHEQVKRTLQPLQNKINELEQDIRKIEHEISQWLEQLRQHENAALNIDLNYGRDQEITRGLQFTLADLSPIVFHSPGTELVSMGSFKLMGGGGLDRRQAERMNAILHEHRPNIAPIIFATKLSPAAFELKQDREQKVLAEETDTYKSFLEHALKYRRGKSRLEQRYASGEYLYHHVAYQNLKEGEIIPVLTDEGAIVNYRAHFIIQHRGMVALALTPVNGIGEVKFLFRGTHDIDSAARDLNAKAAGLYSFTGKERVILHRINQIIYSERQRLHAEGLPENISVSIGGHSLGAADAQQGFVLLQQALAQNKYNRMSGQKSAEKKRVSDVAAGAEASTETEDMLSDSEISQALGDHYPAELRIAVDCISNLRLQAYNAPGVSDETALRSLVLAQFLSQVEEGFVQPKLQAYYQRVNADIVHRAGQAHILSHCPRKFAEVEVLRFLDYRAFSKLAAHTDKQFTREIAGRKDENLDPLCFERMQNDEQGRILNKDGLFEFDDKLEPTAGPGPSITSDSYEVLKGWLATWVKTGFQEPSRGTGKRA